MATINKREVGRYFVEEFKEIVEMGDIIGTSSKLQLLSKSAHKILGKSFNREFLTPVKQECESSPEKMIFLSYILMGVELSKISTIRQVKLG